MSRLFWFWVVLLFFFSLSFVDDDELMSTRQIFTFFFAQKENGNGEKCTFVCVRCVFFFSLFRMKNTSVKLDYKNAHTNDFHRFGSSFFVKHRKTLHSLDACLLASHGKRIDVTLTKEKKKWWEEKVENENERSVSLSRAKIEAIYRCQVKQWYNLIALNANILPTTKIVVHRDVYENRRVHFLSLTRAALSH